MSEWFDRLKQARLDKRISLPNAAAILLTTQQSLIKYEKGEISPQFNLMVKMCELYGVSLNYIAYGNEEGIKIELPLQKQLEVIAVLWFREKLYYNYNSDEIIITDKTINAHLKALDSYVKDNELDDLGIFKCILDFIQNAKS